MRRAMPSLPHTPPCRGTQLKRSTGTTLNYLTSPLIIFMEATRK